MWIDGRDDLCEGGEDTSVDVERVEARRQGVEVEEHGRRRQEEEGGRGHRERKWGNSWMSKH